MQIQFRGQFKGLIGIEKAAVRVTLGDGGGQQVQVIYQCFALELGDDSDQAVEFCPGHIGPDLGGGGQADDQKQE